jgi:choline kinase
MKTVILAAGMGKRMGGISKVLLSAPHPFIPRKQTTLLSRLMLQVSWATNPADIVVVVGYRRNEVVQRILKDFDGLEDCFVHIVTNSKYKKDTNVLSAFLGINLCKDDSYVIIESDILIENRAILEIYNNEDVSTLYTCGEFNRNLYGGICKSCDGKVIDAKIVKEYEDRYKDYNKLLGITKISSKDCLKTFEFLKEDIENKMDQYYWLSWFDRLYNLNIYEGDLSKFKSVSFNTPEDYKKALLLFKED